MSAVTIYTQWPTVKWYPAGTGAPTIYTSGTVIDSSLSSAVEALAATLGVTLTVGAPPDVSAGQLLTVEEGDARYDLLGTAEGLSGVIDGGLPSSAPDTLIDGGTP